MKRKGLISTLAALLLVSAVVIGMLITGANAEEATVIYTVGSVELDGSIHVTEFVDAIDAVEAKNKQWKSDDVVEIRFRGDVSGGPQNGLLFELNTIWREDGTKLPIIIRGVDNKKAKDAYIYLDGAGGWYTCANDYTFINLTLPVADAESGTDFFAGSGNVTFHNIKFGRNGEPVVCTVQDQLNRYEVAKLAAIKVCTSDELLMTLGRLPAGDAWQKVRANPDYAEKNEVDANGVPYSTILDLNGANGSAFGDYSHAGDTGGGQYLNACVYFEAIFGITCVGNTWIPDYNLKAEHIPILQQAAHDAVVEVYGEDYFDAPQDYDVNDDDVVNLLMVGSSSSYYMREELHEIANAAGIKLRIVHAYYSGVKIDTEWAWAQKNAGNYQVYTVWNHSTSQASGQKFPDFLTKYDYDVVVTYQTGNGFPTSKCSEENYNEANKQSMIASCDNAPKLINYIYNYDNGANSEARYFWFQVPASPIGAPGPQSGKGRILGDNNTLAAYAGWTQENIDKYTNEKGRIVSSITFGDNTEFEGAVRGVGYINEAFETPLDDNTAKDVMFMAAPDYEDLGIPDIRPVNTEGQIIINGDKASLFMPRAKSGYSPASATLWLRKGGCRTLTVEGADSAKNESFYGDVTIKMTGGSVWNLMIHYNCSIDGDLTLYISEEDGKAVVSTDAVRTFFGSGTVTGDIYTIIKGGTFAASVYGGGNALGTVYNTITGGNFDSSFYGVRSGTPGHVVNKISNVTFVNYYGGSYTEGPIGPIENHIENVTITGNFCGGNLNNNQTGSNGISSGKVMVDGKEMELAVYNNIKDLTVKKYYYGAYRGTVNGTILNQIDNLQMTEAESCYMGGQTWGNIKGSVINEVKNSNILIYNGAYSSPVSGATVSGNVENTLENCTVTTFNGAFAGAGKSGKTVAVTNDVINVIKDCQLGAYNGAFAGSSYGCTVKGDVDNTVIGDVTFSKMFNGASSWSTKSVLTNKVNGTVINRFQKNENGDEPYFAYDGTFAIYTTGYMISPGKGNVNYIEAGIFDKIYQGGAFTILADPDLTDDKDQTQVFGIVPDSLVNIGDGKNYSVVNFVSGGTFKGITYLGGCTCDGKMSGGVYSEISGGTFKANFTPGVRVMNLGEDQPITCKISGGTFDSTVYLASRGWSADQGDKYTVANVNNTITGGTFKASVYCGGRGKLTVTNGKTVISGGTFKSSLYAGSTSESAGTSSFDLNLQPESSISLAKSVASRNSSETITLKGGNGKVLIGDDVTITASSHDGKTFVAEQTEGFVNGTTYLTVNSANTENLFVVAGSNVSGFVKKASDSSKTTWTGASELTAADLTSGNLLLEEKITLKLWFDKEKTDAAQEESGCFSFILERNDLDKPLLVADYAYLTANAEVKSYQGKDYYVLSLPGTSPSAFHTEITAIGSNLVGKEFSINSMLRTMIDSGNYTEAEANLAKAMWNYGIEAYNRFSGKTSTLAKETVSEPAEVTVINQVNNVQDSGVAFLGKSLVLREAVGIKFFGQIEGGIDPENLPAGFEIRVNGKTLTADEFEIKAEESASYNASITVYIAAASMNTSLEVSVYKNGALCASYTESVTSACQQYVNAGSADALLCKAILAYVEAVRAL